MPTALPNRDRLSYDFTRLVHKSTLMILLWHFLPFLKLDIHGHNKPLLSAQKFPPCVENKIKQEVKKRFASHLFLLTADFAQPFWTGTTDALNATLSAHVLWGETQTSLRRLRRCKRTQMALTSSGVPSLQKNRPHTKYPLRDQ